MTFISCITLKSLIRIMARCIKILALQITCGRTKGRLLPRQLMTWAISFVLPCAQAGFPTSVTDNATPAAGPPGHVGAPRLSRLCLCLLLTLISRDGWCFWPRFFNECQAELQIFICNNVYNECHKWDYSVIKTNNTHNPAQHRPFWHQLQRTAIMGSSSCDMSDTIKNIICFIIQFMTDIQPGLQTL